jgi:meso-butanediol dehydrogenase/(S,S)-butanediol dehydrogenase/diacetyl reductase
MHELRNTATLITGGARGVGRGIALAFAEAGSNVVIGDLLERADVEREADTTVSACREFGVAATAIQLDVRSEEQLHVAADQVEGEFGPLTTVVANAGVIASGRVDEMPVSDWQRVMDVNLTGAWLTCRAFAPRLASRGAGSFVIVSSVAAHRGADGFSAYCASKSGLLGMVNALSHELATRNVRINVISPGYLATDMWFKDILGGPGTSPQEAPIQFDALVASAVPLGRPQTPQDIGEAAVYLASAPNVTGAEIIVDGGRIAGP